MSRVSLLFLLIVISPGILWASDDELKKNPWERFSLSVGGFFTNLNTDVSLEKKNSGASASVNLEDAFNLDAHVTVFRGDALFRFGSSRRHRLDLGYYDSRRHASKNLEKDIEFGGKTYPIGTTVDTFFNMKVIKGGYSYSLLQDERFDFALGVGMYVMDIEVGARAAGSTATGKTVTAPLPTLALRFDVALTPKLFLRTGAEAFFVEAGNFRGGLLSGLAALEYKPWKHFGFGGGYNLFLLGMKSDGSNADLTAKIECTNTGLLLYGKLFF